jgi:hypothetical protein
MMDIVKKNIVSIICGVVALAAVAVAFTMLTSKQEELQKQLDGRKQVYDQLNGLLTKPRQLPVLDPDKPEPKPLTKFPNAKTIEEGGKLTKGVEEEAKRMVAAAAQLNKHTPLVPGSLPEPTSTAGYMFREQYLQYFPQPTGAGGPGGAPGAAFNNSRFAAELHAGMPPTAEDLRIKADELGRNIRLKRLITVGGNATNQAQVDAEVADETHKLPDKMRAAVAENCKVYINPLTFTGWPTILAQPGQPDPVDIFGAQLTLWLQEDVIAAVNDANKDSKNLRDAVVKHLKTVTINPNPFLPPGTATPSADAEGEIKPDKAVSPTGRISNGMYDVYRVTVDADVDAAKLPIFLRAFGQNRFMTPLWADVKSIDNAMELGSGHDYGATPMVNVRAECEVLYLRTWCRPLMPRKVRERLGLPAEEPAPAAPAAGDATTTPAADGTTPTTAPAATPATP